MHAPTRREEVPGLGSDGPVGTAAEARPLWGKTDRGNGSLD